MVKEHNLKRVQKNSRPLPKQISFQSYRLGSEKNESKN